MVNGEILDYLISLHKEHTKREDLKAMTLLIDLMLLMKWTNTL